MGTMTCPDCSTEVPNSESKCSKCGKSFVEAPPPGFLDKERNRNFAKKLLPILLFFGVLYSWAIGTEGWVEIFEAPKTIAGIVDEKPKDPYPNWESKVVLRFAKLVSSMSWNESSNLLIVITTAHDAGSSLHLINLASPKDHSEDIQSVYASNFDEWVKKTLGYKGQLCIGPTSSRASGGRKIHFEFWDIFTKKMIRTLDQIIIGSLEGPDKQRVSISNNGKWIAFNGGGDVRVWNLTTGEERYVFEGMYRDGFTFDGKGNRLAGFYNRSQSASVWDLETGKEILKIENIHFDASPKYGKGNGILFSPDGSMIALAYTGNRGISASTYSGVGRGWSKHIEIREIESGKIIHRLPGNTPMAFSPDGSLFAYGFILPLNRWGHGPNIRIWDVTSGDVRYELKGHKRRPSSIIFGKEGKTIISGGWDGFVRIWKKPD